MKFSKSLSIFVLIWIATLPVSARQNNTEDPLYIYLRDKADSTLVFRDINTWGLEAPHFVILAKKRKKISFYEYVGHSALRGQWIKDFTAVQKKLRRLRRVLITKVTPKMKEYFAIYPISCEEKTLLWKSTLDTDPWGIADDKVDGEGCPVAEDKKFYRIHDAGGMSLALITRNEIRGLDFYAPYHYEKQCPGRKGRAAIIKIATLFTAQTK
ncbi:hypothetical protein [Pedobacter ginsengisoli]|uniref:hypothetical protein n=1 Tax=Pedobacter ginsengisoli TaxID=363852 RepID=UPI00254F83CB|nr:hypothetical protein [Pedobacter ginsengisoli]